MSGSESELNSFVSDEAEVVQDVVAAPVDMPLLSDIWQCKRVETFRELRKNKWCNMRRCLHCGEKFIKSVMKLKYHLGEIRSGDIKICNDIPQEYKGRYRHLIQEYFARKQLLLERKHQEILEMDNHLAAATEKCEKIMPETRKKHGQKTPRTGCGQCKEPTPLVTGKRKEPIPSYVGHSAPITSGASAMASIDLISFDSTRRLIKKPKNMRQPSLSVPTPNGVALMDVMVATFL